MTKRDFLVAMFIGFAGLSAIDVVRADDDADIPFLNGRLIAAGIPGISAVAPVGTFLPGGPIPAKFAAYTQPGRILDPGRILVASTSNFGDHWPIPNNSPALSCRSILRAGAYC